MAKTATIHNPTNFEPRDYEVVDYLDNKRPVYVGEGSEAYADHVAWWEKDMELTLGPDWRSKIGHCIHCGNGNVRWITAVKHLPTGETVVFGSDCTDRLGFANAHAFKLAQLKSRADAQSKRFKVWNNREKFLEEHAELRAAIACIDEPEHAKNPFAKDVIAKLDRYGSLSDRQVAAVIASLARDVEYAKHKATEVEKPKGDAPSGRAEVTGTILSTKVRESDYGDVLKMLVKLDNNAKVWCTVPGDAIVERGDRITVRATWTVSHDDKSFAFGKRPILISQEARA